MPQALPFALSAGFALFNAGVPLVLVNLAVSALTIGAYAFPVVLSAGAQAYSLSKLKQNIAPTNDPAGLQQILKQAIPPQRLVLGRATTGGALFFYRSSRPYIWYGILLAAHEVDGFENLFINGHTVFIGADGFATSVPFRDGDTKYIEVSFRNGHIDQAIDPIIARDFPDMPSTYRQRGHATLVIKAHYGFGADFEEKFDDHKRVYGDQGVLQPLVRMRGARLPDLRRPGVILDDPSTWVWSDNSSLCFARHLVHKWPDTQILSPDRLNWDMFMRAADENDKWELSKDGTTFRRNTANGVVQATDDPWDVIENFKIAMGSHVVLERNKVYPVPRVRREPVATLHQEMIVGGLEYTSEPRDRELVNIVKPTFIAPDREYQEMAGPVLRRADLIAIDGKPREASLRGAFVEDHRRMQRFAAARLNWARNGRTLSVGATLEAVGNDSDDSPWNVGNVHRVHLTGSLAHVNGLYELISREWDERMGGFRLSYAGYDADAAEFDTDDEQDFTLDEDVLEAEAA